MPTHDFVYIAFIIVGSIVLAYVLYKVVALYRKFIFWVVEMRNGNDLSLTLV